MREDSSRKNHEFDRRTMKTTSMMLGTIGLAIVAFASPARSEG